LKPWEYPPCWICVDEIDELLGTPGTERDKISGKRTAAALLRKMLSLGISQYHPDPIAAIEAVSRGP
jgi:hypothetical protein